ncbi:MAG: acetate--CoA ligase family protein [Candidatus Omnitrophica bacterium]|nr:acetate--CoA ligase family protein [Candidatus Omnitrophota bacterium]
MFQGDVPTKVRDLNGLYNPSGVAIIGASANTAKIGYQILNNVILGGFQGGIYPINPKDDMIMGRKAYKSVLDVQEDIDLAVITIPQPLVLGALKECAEKGIKNVAIITSGFAEVGNIEGELELKRVADENDMSIMGPNILGMLYAPSKLNASFGPSDILPGKIAFISQSGALAIALMGWTVMEKIGLATLNSLGNKADLEERDLIEHFNNDDNVDVILIYMEGLKKGREFLATDIKKPVIILKVGRSQRGAKAAASHTGSLAGSDKVYDAAFSQMGVLRAKTFTEAFGWARAFSLPEPAGNNAIIITNGGGIGVSTTDECEASGINLIEDPDWLEERFRATMPSFGSTKNPIDITGGGHGKQYRDAIHVAFTEKRINAVIVLYCETAVTNPMEIAEAIKAEYQGSGRQKPLVVAMVGGERSREALHFLNENNIPSFDAVDQAVSALRVLYEWKEISNRPKDHQLDIETPQEVLDYLAEIKDEGRSVLLEHEARRLLELCGVPTPKWAFATTVDEAVEKSTGMFPLSMKITSPDIIHKTDVGGVVLNIKNEDELREKFNTMMNHVKEVAPEADIRGVNLVKMMTGIECIVGLSHDPQFGPVVMFGLGGVFVEVLKDVAFRVVPFGKLEAERLLGDIQSKKILEGFRGIKADKPSIIQTLCAIQKLAKHVKEIDVNPLITNQNGSFAVDARIII